MTVGAEESPGSVEPEDGAGAPVDGAGAPVPGGRRNLPLVGALGAILLLYTGLALTAAADEPVLFMGVLAGIVGLEWAIEGRVPALARLFRIVQVGVSTRGIIQALTFGLLVARHFPGWGTAQMVGIIALATCLPLSRAAYLLASAVFRAARVRPLETRNIDLGRLAPPPVSTAWMTRRAEGPLVLLGALPLIIGAAGVAAGQIWPFVTLAVAYFAAVLIGVGRIGILLLRTQREPSHAAWEQQVLERIRALEPKVILYFSGNPESAYQINMWLGPLARLPLSTLVLVRERHVLRSLAPTNLPVVCMPSAVSVMRAKFASARVALYPANTSKNIHLLREPGMRHVFIGHGDSDKISSINPFTKVYDEVWVAGRAARDRWAEARVGVRDEAVVEVGRPQLEAVIRTKNRPSVPLTVLYAPTWEGWNDEDFTTSLTHMGPRLIEGLLAADPPVRIVYKPHPFTGKRDKRARAAHQAIVAMISEANRGQDSAASDTRLAEVERLLSGPGLGPAEEERLGAEWNERFWSLQPDLRHIVVDGPLPRLFDCFNRADILVTDVSSVVSDFLASGKPYVCANTRGVDRSVFVTENPSAGAAYLLGPDCSELPDVLSAVRGDDPMSDARDALREYLLGPDDPPSIVRWEAAIESLSAKVETRDTLATGIDGDAFDHASEFIDEGGPFADTSPEARSVEL